MGLQSRSPVPRAERRPWPVQVVSRYRAFHRPDRGALAATGQAQRKYKDNPLVPGFLHVQPPDRYRCHYCSEKDACNLEVLGR